LNQLEPSFNDWQAKDLAMNSPTTFRVDDLFLCFAVDDTTFALAQYTSKTMKGNGWKLIEEKGFKALE